jgi:hypothetical protein
LAKNNEFFPYLLKKTQDYKKSYCKYFDIKGIFWGDYEVIQIKPEVLQTKPDACDPVFTRLTVGKPEETKTQFTFIEFFSRGVYCMLLMKNDQQSG